MDKTRKKNIKRGISFICVMALVLLLAAMPLIARQAPEEDGPQASILSGKAATGSIQTELISGGILAEDAAVTVTVPSDVKLTGFLVSNGDAVTAGTPIATVDRVTVMTAIMQVQETLENLSEQIAEAKDADDEEKVVALAGGKVKILYAEEGKSVQSIMLEHGALAVLSLDGLMAVEFETESKIPAGSEVTVTLSDGTAATGVVKENLAGEMTVTLEDDSYAVGTEVKVTDVDGGELGVGELYIYSPWNATAYAGTVETVKISEGDTLDPGDTMLLLSDVGYTATYHQLVSQRQDYEELMLELFEMYQSERITAPCDGIVSGIDENSIQLLSAENSGFFLQLLSNAPNGDDETLYDNYVGMVTTVARNGWVLKVNSQLIPIADYMELAGITVDKTLMTETVLHTQTSLPIFGLEEGQWVLIEKSSVKTGDVLLFATDGEGGLVWSVLLERQENQQPDGTDTPADPGVPETPGESEGGTTPSNPGESEGGTTPPVPGGSEGGTTPSVPGGSGSNPGFSYPSGGSGFGGISGGMVEQEPTVELYDLEMTQIAAVTPQTNMTMEITVDEMDVTALKVGMAAQIRIDALGGEKFMGTITRIGNSGTNSGGSSKYTVELTVERSGNMLAGMSGTVSVVLEETGDVITIPADALVELGNETVVYTGYDEENKILLNPVTVQIGVSDGESVEIIYGLSNGQTYYYAYYDTLEISFTPDFGNGGFMFG